MVEILTTRENEIIDKKIKGLSLTQNESNILSKTIRPKLNQIKEINAEVILDKIGYNQKAKSIEERIKKIILENIDGVDSIIVCGSAIQSNYREYNDIDVIIATKKRLNDEKGEKRKLKRMLMEIAEKDGLVLDIQIYAKESILAQYPYSPSLIYQLKDSKVIYGKLKDIPKTALSKLDLRMKLDWSNIDTEDSEGKEIYQSLRNVILVKLLLNKIVDNYRLKDAVNKELGENTVIRLKKNLASKLEKRALLKRIEKLSDQTDKEILEGNWEKIVV